MDGETPSKINLLYTESKVVFSICDCSLRDYSFYKLNREEATNFIKRLRHIEKLTWGQLTGLQRDNGLTVEKPDSDSFNMIHEQNSSEQKVVEQYYFHFRVEQTGRFRVFGYQRDQLFCITHIDPRAKIHGHN